MTERHLDLLQKHRELQKAFDDTLEMNRKLGSENWKFEKENKELKQQIKKIGDFIQAGDLCSICKFENKCNPKECFNQNIRVYTKWELGE